MNLVTEFLNAKNLVIIRNQYELKDVDEPDTLTKTIKIKEK